MDYTEMYLEEIEMEVWLSLINIDELPKKSKVIMQGVQIRYLQNKLKLSEETCKQYKQQLQDVGILSKREIWYVKYKKKEIQEKHKFTEVLLAELEKCKTSEDIKEFEVFYKI